MPHIHEKIDFTVETFIVHKNKVLLRMHDKYHIWLTPGGHVELGEDPVEAAIREAREEAGIAITIEGSVPDLSELPPGGRMVIPPRFMYRHHITESHEHLALIYFASAKTDKVVAGGHDRSEEMKWFTESELEDPKYGVSQDIHFYATQALKAAIIEKW
jgi:8-oxo-dGTP pyrophosphatase MutT (NUDIX family)